MALCSVFLNGVVFCLTQRRCVLSFSMALCSVLLNGVVNNLSYSITLCSVLFNVAYILSYQPQYLTRADGSRADTVDLVPSFPLHSAVRASTTIMATHAKVRRMNKTL